MAAIAAMAASASDGVGRRRRGQLRTWLALTCALALLCGAAPVVHAQEAKAKAVDLAARAKAAYRDGKFEEAANLFKSAYAAVPEPTLLFNAARAYQQGGLQREALTLFRLYLQLATADDAETRGGRAEAIEHIAAIERSLGAEAQREQDEAARVKTEREALEREQQRHREREAAARAAEGERRDAQPRPQPAPQPIGLPPPAAPGAGAGVVAAPAWTGREMAALSTAGGGVVLLIVGVITHATASGVAADLQDRLDAAARRQDGVTFYPGVTQVEVDRARADHDSLRLRGHVLVGLGAAAAGVGAWLWWGRQPATEAARLSLQPLDGGGLLALQGSF